MGFCVYRIILARCPPRFRSFGMNTLGAVPARSLRNNDLEVKYLFLRDLALFAPAISALGPLPLFPASVVPPFRPEQKVKLDKSEAGTGGSFLASWRFGSEVGTGPVKQMNEKLEGTTRPTPGRTSLPFTSSLHGGRETSRLSPGFHFACLQDRIS